MRVAIREQLAFLVLFLVLLALCIVSVPTWIYVHNFVIDVEADSLSLTASLKTSRISAELELIQTSCFTISSRILIQNALRDFYETGTANWDDAAIDIQSALSVGAASTGLLQARLFSRNQTGASNQGLLNVTAPNPGRVVLPYQAPNGSDALLGDPDYGYPPELYPNITYVDLGRNNIIRPDNRAIIAEAFPGVVISRDGGLLLGPMVLNESAALISISVPIRDNNDTFILGYMTVLALASSIIEVRDSREGLGNTGVVLLIGPTAASNRFNSSLAASNATYMPDKTELGEVDVKFILPPVNPTGTKNRHSDHKYADGTDSQPFPLKSYPAALRSFADRIHTVNNASSMLSTHNEQGSKVSVGFARTQTPLVNWTVIVEKARSESYAPIDTLRNILLGTVFGTAGFVLLLIFPLAHLSVLPIARLKHATEKSVNPPGYEESLMESDLEELPGSGNISQKSKKGLVTTIVQMMRRRPRKTISDRDAARRLFKIPGKVEDRKHFIKDELTELTETFNDMSDELVKQYMSLDEKVAERTKELEESKKAAEAANESKTLFIANISHELKTPLNGILGMCAICMEETDISRIKQSLKTLYKSGDLLLHLLEDLLSFSKNQIGQQLKMELKEFRLGDIRSQILTIFDKQVREGNINFSVNFISSSDAIDLNTSPEQSGPETMILPALGPRGTGRLKDMCLWGDQHRVLQVLINLVNNSLKFTPAGGKVEVRIRCIGEVDPLHDDESRTSSLSKNSRTGRTRNRGGSSSSHSVSSGGRASGSRYSRGGTALSINPMEPKPASRVQIRERSSTPPPAGARTYTFEFEVQDSGPGIPEHMQEKVFEPFVQGDLGLSKKYGGTGLGLSICHQLAGLMGGSIGLESEMGSGTTFTMHIPLKYVKDRASSTASSSVHSRRASVEIDVEGTRTPVSVGKPAVETKASNALNPQPRLVGLSHPFFAANPSPTPKSTEDKLAEINKVRANKEGQGKLRVLVADDNSTNIEVVSRMLKLEEVYDVTIAKDGQEAYDEVKAAMERNEAFDIIFMDVQMPNLNGLQSTRLIREMGYTSPIVALTAFSEESNMRDCINSGMDEFLAKPIRRPALKQVLKKFATILEEPETTSVVTTKKSTLDEERPLDEKTPATSVHDQPTPPLVGPNGPKFE